MRTLKLYGSGSSTGNAIAQVTIPSKGRIVGIQASVMMDQVADNSAGRAELSKSSASEIGVNGAQQCICEVGLYGNLVTSGLTGLGVNQFFPVDVPVDQGQIIYLHFSCTTTTIYATFLIHYL